MKKTLFLALALAIPFCGIAYSQQTQPNQQETVNIASIADPSARMAAYRKALATGNYAQAQAFLADGEVLAMDMNQNGSILKAQASALTDLYSLMNKDWKIEQHNILCKAITERIGNGKPLSYAGVGPQPEKLLTWLKRNIPDLYNDNEDGKQRLYVVNQAIRNWETLFGQAANRAYEWDGVPLIATKEQWNEMQLLDRNATLKKIARHLARLGDNRYLAYDADMIETMTVQVTQAESIKQALQSNILSEKQKTEIMEARTVSEKAYLLNKFFDGSNVRQDDPIRVAVNATRTSYPDEDFDAQSRQLLGSMLNTSIAEELKGTSAGDRIGSNLQIKVEFCNTSYSKIDEENPDVIVLDEETIQQYMRIKGYTAESVIKDRNQLKEIARYMSPAVVYEAAHRDQQKWAKGKGMGKTDLYITKTQEDEIDAMSQQALYVAEKMKTDKSFYNEFSSIERYSKYAAKQVQGASSYSQGKKMFADTVRTANQNLPTISSYTADLINAVSDELSRRAALSMEERTEESLNWTMTFSDGILGNEPDVIKSNIRFYEEGALSRLRSELSAGAYEEYNRQSIAATRQAYNELDSEKKQKGSIPLPK